MNLGLEPTIHYSDALLAIADVPLCPTAIIQPTTFHHAAFCFEHGKPFQIHLSLAEHTPNLKSSDGLVALCKL